MSLPSSVLQALSAAIEADPEDLALRLHLAPLLLQAGDAAAALEQVAAVLARDPANLDALRLGAEAAAAVGDPGRAAGYARLVQALAGEPAPQPTPVSSRRDDPYDLSKLPRSEAAVDAETLEPLEHAVGAELAWGLEPTAEEIRSRPLTGITSRAGRHALDPRRRSRHHSIRLIP